VLVMFENSICDRLEIYSIYFTSLIWRSWLDRVDGD
jgi:hypothetical protein